jgi:hypothetical protein
MQIVLGHGLAFYCFEFSMAMAMMAVSELVCVERAAV